MSVSEQWIRYGEDQAFSGYLAVMERAGKPLPAVIVIQEIWGVDEHIQDVTRRFAQAGYAALAPDLYAVRGERPEALTAERIGEAKHFMDSLPPGAWGDPEQRKAALARLPQAEQERISLTMQSLFGGRDPGGYVKQLFEAASYLRNDCEASRGCGVASVGFCLGGALSARLAAADPELKGAVIFYGSAPDSGHIRRIRCPVIGFYGEKDARITGQVPAFEQEMKAAGKTFTAHIYPGAQHAFFNDTRSSYQADAARHAFAETLRFFGEVLQAPRPE